MPTTQWVTSSATSIPHADVACRLYDLLVEQSREAWKCATQKMYMVPRRGCGSLQPGGGTSQGGGSSLGGLATQDFCLALGKCGSAAALSTPAGNVGSAAIQ